MKDWMMSIQKKEIINIRFSKEILIY